MSIKMTTPKAEINAFIVERVMRLKRTIVRTLCYVGEQCRNAQIQRHRYINRTGNLESSTGYIVVVDGKVVGDGGFKGGKYHSAEGAQEGRSYAEQLASTVSEGICLVVVAGKNYARYVADKGLDVLDTAELTAERLIPQMMSQLEG